MIILNFFRSSFGKLLVAATVLMLLFYNNSFDFDQLKLLQSKWQFFLSAFLLTLPPFIIVSYRFKILLLNQGIVVSFGDAFRWTMIGSFFDLIMPSSNGGDVMKAGYLVKHVGPGFRSKAIMSVAFDRVIGLLGLFVLALVAAVVGWPYLDGIENKNTVILVLMTLVVGTMLFFRILGANRIHGSKRINKFLSSRLIGQKVLQLVGSFNNLRKQPGQFFLALALSVVNHCFWCCTLLMISYSIGNDISVAQGFVVFPVAIFFGVFGFAGGFGVGTLAFSIILEKTLLITNGALVGLIFQIFGLVSRLFGLPFYIYNKPEVNN